jgi:hypothetical protein
MLIIRKLLYKIQFIFPHKLLRIIKRNIQLNNLTKWKQKGYPTPPPHIIKVYVLKFIANKKNLQNFVETGTFMGDMLEELKNNFKYLYSIELFTPLYKRAVKIFKNNKNIKILNGDSGILIKNVIRSLDKPTLFWLDAHYSGSGTAKSNLDTPIEKELEIISQFNKSHVIVIDDARLFNGNDDYPKLSKLKETYKSRYTISVIHDMIVLVK